MTRQLDVHRAVGKLITGKLPGTTLDTVSESAIVAGIMSGITMFKDNAVELNQLFDLVAQSKAVGGEDFIVCVDQEGGAVQRFDAVLTPMPSAMALAAINHDGRVYDLMHSACAQLANLGVNCNLAPVLDVNSNPLNPIIGTRSFGDDPERIAKLGLVVVRAHLDNHILPVGKHFPGHGDTQQDSHLSLAIANADRQLLAERELKPFADCALKLPAMLAGHVWLPAFDPEPLPASLSHAVSTELLRGELQFGGYLFTDDLPVMKAIVDNWGLEEAAVMAINAGADNLLVSASSEQIFAVHRALANAVAEGTIKEARLEQAINRRRQALSITTRGAGVRSQARRLLTESVASSRHAALQASIAAIASISGKNSSLQRFDHILVLVPNHSRYKLDICAHLRRLPALSNVHIEELRYSLDLDEIEVNEIAGRVAGKDCLLVTFRALLNRGQLQLASAVAQAAKARMAIAADVPYELAAFTKWECTLATFDPSDLAMEAVANVLSEGSKPRGRCPVKLAP
jgi:beta-N-acetylhexosaminidase